MAQFPGLSLTIQGNKMILKSATGRADDRLIITKAVIGDGQLTNSCIVDPQLQIWEHQYVYDKFPELHTKEYRKCLKNVLAKNRKQILKQRIKNFFVRSEK